MENLNHIEILLIEDNQYDAEMAILALKESNISDKVAWFQESEKALDFLFCNGKFKKMKGTHRSTIKLILLDLKMPKINGLQVLQEIKTMKSTQFIPVVMFTSSKEEKDITQSYELGVNSFVVKPVEFEKYNQAVVNTGLYWTAFNQTHN